MLRSVLCAALLTSFFFATAGPASAVSAGRLAATQQGEPPAADASTTASASEWLQTGEWFAPVAEWLVLGPVDGRGRRPFREDAVFGRHLFDPRATPPVDGEALRGSLATGRWERRAAGVGGGPTLSTGGGLGWAFGRVHVPPGAEGIYLVRLAGAFDGWIDGAPFAGDGYRYGLIGRPVYLDEGEHPVWVGGMRGGFDFQLLRPVDTPVVVDTRDVAMPELGVDDVGRPVEIGVALGSLRRGWQGPVRARVAAGGDFEPGVAGGAWPLAPLGAGRLALTATPLARTADDRRPWRLPLELEVDGEGAALAFTLEIPYRDASEPRLRTYRSRVDGAVLPYGVLAPASVSADTGLVLSLHGASVGAASQIRAYSPKASHVIAAPTNRRPFGFDWQDWGRRDAVEVARVVERSLGLDTTRRAVTGHSMGGHGTWHLAAFDAGAFAAAAPSAGWQSFDTYGGPRPSGGRADTWRAADRGSETARAIEAIARLAIFVLHGAADETVPASEARQMLELLEQAGAQNVAAHFEPGAGHWWDGDVAEGADCVDWPPLFDVIRAARRDPVGQFAQWPAEGERVAVHRVLLERPDGYTFDDRWLDVAALATPGLPGRYAGEIRVQDGAVAVALTTQGLATFEYFPPGDRGTTKVLELEIDGTVLRFAGEAVARPVAIDRDIAGVWRVRDDAAFQRQRPGASGPFKRVFDRGPVLVVGTTGAQEESAELLAVARFDAQRWDVRAAGELPIVRDSDVIADTAGVRFGGRNLILYGNRESNGAFAALVPRGGPFDARRGAFLWVDAAGQRTESTGSDLGALVVRPRTDSHGHGGLLGLIADSGPRGTRLHHLGAWMVSGVGLPDFVLFDAGVLARADKGVLRAGFWTAAWGPP